ncbi:branched-chain amino acid ABC transporter permease [Aquibium sp. ELW1220]|jgi:branched-chain amino acid transport system permease protein|uniref:branched-chain amino acid ABC transporter permease n=1 Tax=Aquibium sp. ELW1220 TaxID=2976766 RepID=UPI0025AFBA6D|nr:branched-chain amino acid ABC transporter permease [Aquibium sp. ELW1220]MDN2582091.1 branched-chain amino acid ABC transporter permease [Aquibium sp. ELW1220]
MIRLLLIAAAIALLAVAPFHFYTVTLMTIMCFVVFACSFNLLLGYSGLLCFGHAMFFGGAAYVTGYILKSTPVSIELAILAGAAVSGLLGLLIGMLTIRRQGIQFAMITLAFSQFIYFILLQSPFTGGEDGMQAIPRNPMFGILDVTDNFTYYYVVMAITLVSVFVYYRVVHSPYGEILKAVRDNQPRVESLGFDPERIKLLAFVISATMAGVAGGMKATVYQFATLTDASWPISAEVILMTLLGGLGTLLGPIFGAGIIIWLNDYLAGFGEWALISQGVILLVVIVFFRRGFVGELSALATFLANRRKPAAKADAPKPASAH